MPLITKQIKKEDEKKKHYANFLHYDSASTSLILNKLCPNLSLRVIFTFDTIHTLCTEKEIILNFFLYSQTSGFEIRR